MPCWILLVVKFLVPVAIASPAPTNRRATPTASDLPCLEGRALPVLSNKGDRTPFPPGPRPGGNGPRMELEPTGNPVDESPQRPDDPHQDRRRHRLVVTGDLTVDDVERLLRARVGSPAAALDSSACSSNNSVAGPTSCGRDLIHRSCRMRSPAQSCPTPARATPTVERGSGVLHPIVRAHTVTSSRLGGPPHQGRRGRGGRRAHADRVQRPVGPGERGSRRPASGGARVLLPLGGAGAGFWTQIDQGSPGVGIAIANPDNGPGAAFEQNYATRPGRVQRRAAGDRLR